MLNLIIILTSCLFNFHSPNHINLKNNRNDSTNFFKRNNLSAHIGINLGWGFAGGFVNGGAVNFSPRLGIAWKKKLIIGVEYAEAYQIEFQKDSIANRTLYLNKWKGAFIRYYFSPNFKNPNSRFKLFILANAITGKLFLSDYKRNFYESYKCIIAGTGVSFKIKKIQIEGGARATFGLSKQLNHVFDLNLIFMGISYVF